MASDRTQSLAVAAAHESGGRLAEAERIYRALLAADSDDFETLLRLGTLKIVQGQPEDGERMIRRCTARGLTSASAQANLAAAFLALRRFEDAIVHCRQALALEPGNVEAHVSLGSAFQAQKRHDEAIESYRRALAVVPDLLTAHFNLATALQALARHDEAIACYERVLAADPDIVEAQFGIGTALIALGRGEEAITRFKRALASDPEFVEAAVAMGRALQSLGRHEEAVSRYQRTLDIDPDYADARSGLATALQALGKHEEAIASFEALRAVAPDNPIVARIHESYRARGLASVKAGHYEEAFNCYEKTLRLRPDDAIAHAEFGFALTTAGKAEEAVVQYRHAVALDPDHTDIQINLGAVLVQTGRLEEARRVYQRVMALKPEVAAPYVTLSALQRMTPGDPMLDTMERLVAAADAEGRPDAMKLHFALGKAYEDIGEPERSFRHLTAANAIKRREVTYNEAPTLGSFEYTGRLFTPQFLRRTAGSGDPSKIPVFILGYPRSGSTLVEQVLASHPSVVGGGERRDFDAALAPLCPQFPDGVTSLSGDALRQLGARYVESLTRAAPDAARITDKMPGNFIYIGLIRLALPNAHIIHTCRDPVDTCLSCFANSFEGSAVPFTYDLAELGRHYHAYAALMERWRRVLPADAMLEVHYEDVVANFEHEARRIVAYCGLPWDDSCLAFHKTQRVVQTASAYQVRQPIYQSSVGRARPLGDLLRPLLDALA